ncbi:helix-turn-helix transcriptional regulator [Rhodopirellula sp. MGV]|uniref:helix-turn-helix transcriptional regulator n=1 Tax=Rhodopirellula sp. MGV TaxID=2023130 RepID=UPI0013042CBB|nr:AlpA family phage regulatory protein [Rhodopirellula sp. MGV]
MPDNDRFIEAPEILETLGFSDDTLYRLIATGKFPKPLRLGIRKRVWLRATFEQHIQDADPNRDETSEAKQEA